MPTVTIIGGGPAGSIAAIVLARAGWEVTLFERHRGGRDKVCGECLANLGIEVLTRLGLRERIEALEPAKLNRASFMPAVGREIMIALDRPMWGLSRRVLDGALLAEARASGAQVHMAARMEAIDPETREITCRHLDDNSVTTHQSDYILLACGAGAGASAAHGGDMGIKAHFLDLKCPPEARAGGTISLFGVRGHYAGLAPIEEGRWNMAMSVPATKIRGFGGDLDALFAGMLDENPKLAAKMAGARRIGRWLASPLPRFGLRPPSDPRIVRIGNAAAAIEPVGGQGMALAMRSAELVAEHLIKINDRSPIRGSIDHDLARLWRRRRVICRAGAVVLSHPWLARVAAPIAPVLAPMALSAMH